MIWISTRTLPILVTTILWLHPVLVYAFAFEAQRGNAVLRNQTSGRPVIWNPPRVTMSLNLGSPPNGVLINGTTSWDTNAEDALAVWNTVLPAFFTFNTTGHNRCDRGDGFNTVAFDRDNCGDGFGDMIAITRLRAEEDADGDFFWNNADVLFNSTYPWNAYSGPVRLSADGRGLADLHREALHEFGHVLGLDHPNEAGQTVSAIMDQGSVRDPSLDTLTQDDKAGALFLYSKSSPAGGSGSGGSNSSAGCTINPRAGFDPMLVSTTALILVYLIWKRTRQAQSALSRVQRKRF